MIVSQLRPGTAKKEEIKTTDTLTKENQNDPIAIAIKARKDAKTETITEVEAKKSGVPVPKALKLVFKKTDMEINLLPASDEKIIKTDKQKKIDPPTKKVEDKVPEKKVDPVSKETKKTEVAKPEAKKIEAVKAVAKQPDEKVKPVEIKPAKTIAKPEVKPVKTDPKKEEIKDDKSEPEEKKKKPAMPKLNLGNITSPVKEKQESNEIKGE